MSTAACQRRLSVGPAAKRSGGTLSQRLAANRREKVPPLRLASLGFGRDDGSSSTHHALAQRLLGGAPGRLGGPTIVLDGKPARGGVVALLHREVLRRRADVAQAPLQRGTVVDGAGACEGKAGIHDSHA